MSLVWVLLVVGALLVWLLRKAMPLMGPREHQLHYELLQRFSRLCHDGRLWMIPMSGTLLGAIRHQGFIPWDNDVDVGMMTEGVKILEQLPRSTWAEYGLLWKKRPHGLYKVFLTSTGASVGPWHSKPCVDVFALRQSSDRIEYASAAHRKMWPREWFHLNEVSQLVPYQFGPLTLMGPSSPQDFCPRIFGPDWQQGKPKWTYACLYPWKVRQLIRQDQQTRRLHASSVDPNLRRDGSKRES